MITKQTLLQSLSRFLADCKNIFASKSDTYTKTETNSKLDEKVDKVLMEKTFGPYTISANTKDKGWLFFINVIPTNENWAVPWSVKYKVYISTSESNTQGEYDCMWTVAATTASYNCFNKVFSSSYLPTYNHLVAYYNNETKYASRDTYPIKIGERVEGARMPTTLPRTFKIQILDYEGCEVSFTDEPETYDSFYTDANYGSTATVVGTVGLQETGDTNHPNYFNYFYYNGFKLSDTSAPLYRYKFVGFDEKMRIIPFNITDQTNSTLIEKTPCPLGFTVSNGMAWYNTTTPITAQTQTVANGTMYHNASNFSGWTMVGSNFNSVVGYASNGTLNSNVYWCGDYNPITDKFYLDRTNSTSWYTVVSNESDSTAFKQAFTAGKYYWLIGHTCALDGQFSLFYDHPLYYFDGDNLVPAEAINQGHLQYDSTNKCIKFVFD